MSRRALALAALAAVAGGCNSGPEMPPAVDPALVDLLAELHLADARAALDTTVRAPAHAESLRTVALAAHGLDQAGLDDALDRLANDPVLAREVYNALDTRLALERQGLTPEPPMDPMPPTQ